MKQIFSKFTFYSSLGIFLVSSLLMFKGVEPLRTYYYIVVWWSYLLIADSWLYQRGEDSFIMKNPLDFFTFLVPLSSFFWFLFEAVNLRLHNWAYVGVPSQIVLRWGGNFLAFGTVLPAIGLTSNLLDHFGVYRRNDFSHFFNQHISRLWVFCSISIGFVMSALPLIYPQYFFPLIWGALFFLCDPINGLWDKSSLIQEWRQGNWNRTLQLLISGLICGFLWEFWNFWAGAKWVYIFNLPEWLLPQVKLFEMPLAGFLGFLPFALECFAFTEFTRGLRERSPRTVWIFLVVGASFFSLMICYFMDIHTVREMGTVTYR